MSRHALLIALAACCAARLASAGAIELPYQVGGAYSVPVVSLKETRFASTIRQQYDFSCGSAALATLLTHHYKFAVSEDAVFEAMFRNGDQAKIKIEGFSLLDMKRYLEAHGFEADGFQEPIEKLAAANIPAIVLVNESGYNHFVVVKGLRDGRVLVGDPAGGTRAMTVAAFNAVWTNGVVFVINNRQDRAAFNAANDWLAVPAAPIRSSIARDGLGNIVIPKLGSADF
jgi:uncharacterized protein